MVILTDIQGLTKCIGKCLNEWLTPFRHGWSNPPFTFLPRWRDGKLVLNALAQYPAEIPEYDRTIPYAVLTFAEEPTLSHVLEDLFQTPMKDLSIIDQGMRQSPDSGLTKAQFMANFIEADAIRGHSAATRLYSIVDLRFQERGSHRCRLQAPGYLDAAGTIVESNKDGLSWGSTLVPLGTFTDIHFDYNGQAQLMVGIKCLKLWLIWPPTPKNLEWISIYRTRIPTGLETAEAVRELEGMTYLIQRTHSAFILPPYHLHAVLSYEASAHCGVGFWNVSNWEEFARQGIEWELEWAKSYVAHGHGIECGVDTVKNISNSVKTLGKVAKLGGRKSRDLLNWVGPMAKKVSDVTRDLKNRRSESMDDGIVS